MKKYIPSELESKWQRRWEESDIYKIDLSKPDKKYYLLVEFTYPSGDLHMGHWFAFAVPDILARMKRMQGYNVFAPNGFDAFGLPAENAAIRRGVHPQDWTIENIKKMKEQFTTMGAIYDWEHEVITCMPNYYKWNQWIFLKMFEKGLAYRGKTLSNWCPVDQSVLANENVENGKCWRCGADVVQKEVDQWFFKITDFAEELLWNDARGPVSSFPPASAPPHLLSQVDNPNRGSKSKGEGLRAVGSPSRTATPRINSNDIDWPKSLKDGQNNWIGKSEGIEIDFPIKGDYNFVLLHGYGGTPHKDFFPWLLENLKNKGYRVQVPQLPDTDNPTEVEQVEFVLKNCKFDKNTVLLGHSLGTVVAMKVLEKLDNPIAGLVLVAGFTNPEFKDNKIRPFKNKFSWDFDFTKIKKNAGKIIILSDINDPIIPLEEGRKLATELAGELKEVQANTTHFNSPREESILANIVPKITVFTKFPETIYGVTYMVLAPEHPLVKKLVTDGRKNEVDKYIKVSQKKSELERISIEKDKTGVSTGSYCINPVNGKEVSIWIADYVIASYGTGAVMGVPGSDTRDFEFAKKFDLPVIKVIAKTKNDLSKIKSDHDVLEQGYIVNSGQFNGLASPDPAKKEFMDFLEDKGWGNRKVNYHLHDWSVSRQRYWGTPIPIIYCDNCGTVPVPEKDLPVELPYEVDYAPKGKPPLATAEEWVNVKCPECGRNAKRETETMDTFVDSSWYFLRYLDPKNDEEITSKKVLADWMPVDIYFGGAEHTLGHTLYSRFFVKFLKKIGVLDFDEYAKKRVHHGVILGPDGSRMSKSRGNVVNPDDEVKKFGADSVRMYLAFLGPYDLVAPWNPTGINGVYHFLQRVWALAEKVTSDKLQVISQEDSQIMNKTIKKVTEDIENIKFNTAVAALMEWLNYLSQKAHRVNSASVIASEAKQSGNEIASDSSNPRNDSMLVVSREEYQTLLKLLAPFAPHITEELYQQFFGNPKSEIRNPKFHSIHNQPWPKYDPKLAKSAQVTIVVQVNGKLRDRLTVEAGKPQKDAEQLALSSQKVQKFVGGKKPRKAIFVADRLINFVV